MTTYVVSGIALRTDLDLPELPMLPPGEVVPRSWTLEGADGPVPSPAVLEFDLHTIEGRLWCRVGSGEGLVTFAFPGKLDVVVRPEARRVELAPAPGLAATTLRHLVIDQLVPNLLRLDGEVVLHADAVAVEDEALAFLGPTGAGKSSLAGGFLQQGGELLADDFLVVREADGRHLATAAYPGLRLWRDSAEHFADDPTTLTEVADYSDKQRWAVPAPAVTTDVPLRALLVLGDTPQGDDEPACSLGELRGRDAFMLLYSQTFRVAGASRARQEAELDWLARLAETVPVLLVEHQHAYDDLPEVVAEIRAALGRHRQTTGR